MHVNKSWLIVIAISLLSLTAFSQDAQEVAIKKTIADETAAFLKRDVEAWKSTWLQDAKTSRINTHMFGSTFRIGWDSVSKGALKFLKENPMPDSATVNTDSFNIRREGNMAIVDYKQVVKFPNTQPPFGESTSREQRVLVKKNGKWLITAVTSTDITNLGTNGTELSLNAIGYKYLYAGNNDDAIKVLELNTVLFPKSFNVWDSLGEAYAKAGNKEKAIECYEKSLAIYPSNESGKKALADLK
jgi:tetratricopeptide (TPR) repeat protein